MKERFHIGLATDTEKGFVVPVLKNVDKKSVEEIHAEMKGLIEKAREIKLQPNDMKGSTFTIHILGPTIRKYRIKLQSLIIQKQV